MILSELMARLEGQSKVIFDLLWDILEGKLPSIDFLTSTEVKKIFLGEDIDGVRSPFVLLSKNMVIRKLPLMILQTSKNKRTRQRQMSVNRMLETVNKMLEILELEAESIELLDIVF
ncbi:MAG: hypothetical protein CMM25_04055 [Rhodospirillaceae bacterium]|nr:hypothetical protein [Rhodospirillaceae bacterium]